MADAIGFAQASFREPTRRRRTTGYGVKNLAKQDHDIDLQPPLKLNATLGSKGKNADGDSVQIDNNARCTGKSCGADLSSAGQDHAETQRVLQDLRRVAALVLCGCRVQRFRAAGPQTVEIPRRSTDGPDANRRQPASG